MRSLILAALAATALSGSAHADQFNCHSSYWHGSYTSNCSYGPTPKPRELTQDEVAERDAEIAKWEAFCKPVRVPDENGVIHLRYAEKGCEFGRSE